MTKYALMLAAAGLLVAAPAVVKAEEHAADHAAPAAAEAPAADAAAAKEVTLKDGTKVHVEGDMVSVVAADGTKTPAPDGDHTDMDGNVLTVKDGKLVK